MADWKIHDAQEKTKEVARASLDEDYTAIYNARGCDYEFDFVEDRPGQIGATIYCFNRKGEIVWSASTYVTDSERVIDTVRDARRNSNL